MTGNHQRIRCPHCHAELALPSGGTGGSGRRRWRLSFLIVGLCVLGCLVLAYRYKGQLITILDLANEVTGSTALSLGALGLAALAALSVAGWFLVPFLFAWAYLDLRRRLGAPPLGRLVAPAPRSEPATSPTPPAAPPAA